MAYGGPLVSHEEPGRHVSVELDMAETTWLVDEDGVEPYTLWGSSPRTGALMMLVLVVATALTTSMLFLTDARHASAIW